jgi:hypothetical protein
MIKMDEKIKSGLLKLNVTSEPVLLKNLGITKTIATTMEKIGLLELKIIQTSSRSVKTPNAAIITDFGKNLLFLSQNPDVVSDIKLQRTFKDFFNTVESTYHGLKELTKEKTNKDLKSNFFLTENLVLKEINAYKSAMKSGAEIPVLVNSLMEKTKLPKEKIHSYIYQLHLNNKVSLQSGQGIAGDPLITTDGSKYFLVK